MLPKKQVKRPKTPQEALASLQRLCARAERSSGDALRLMATWEVESSKRREVLDRLIQDRFIDDKRYAEAFIREKTSLSAWGEYKIRTALRRKGISEEIISHALQDINPQANAERLRERLERKAKNIRFDNTFQLKTKLLRYGLSLGFSMEQVLGSVEQVVQNINTGKQCDDEFYF
ncbi:MAG: RecX family transcriptional regulator [Alistipes sp.]|nr:RecX family transcriptional regulator [Alistipes sp.]